jgi:hypothetical protein
MICITRQGITGVHDVEEYNKAFEWVSLFLTNGDESTREVYPVRRQDSLILGKNSTD